MKYILITLVLFVSSCATTKKPPVGDFLPLAQSYANNERTSRQSHNFQIWLKNQGGIVQIKGFKPNNVACPDECKW